jgi:hypothetical protein
MVVKEGTKGFCRGLCDGAIGQITQHTRQGFPAWKTNLGNPRKGKLCLNACDRKGEEERDKLAMHD